MSVLALSASQFAKMLVEQNSIFAKSVSEHIRLLTEESPTVVHQAPPNNIPNVSQNKQEKKKEEEKKEVKKGAKKAAVTKPNAETMRWYDEPMEGFCIARIADGKKCGQCSRHKDLVSGLCKIHQKKTAHGLMGQEFPSSSPFYKKYTKLHPRPSPTINSVPVDPIQETVNKLNEEANMPPVDDDAQSFLDQNEEANDFETKAVLRKVKHNLGIVAPSIDNHIEPVFNDCQTRASTPEIDMDDAVSVTD